MPLDDVGRQPTHGCGELGRVDQPDRHRLAVPPPELLDLLDRVAQRVAVVEHLAVTGLAQVARNDPALKRTERSTSSGTVSESASSAGANGDSSIRRKMAHVDQEFADARRYLSALCAEDNQALGALMAEIHRSGRAMNVLAAMAVQALDFAHLSADRLGGDVQKWLDESVMAQDTAETERDQTELGGEG